jgi:pyruvate formate-lyase activating enzyme-like uncharacterized protein
MNLSQPVVHSKGCELCQIGAKMVLFVTGECYRECFYCPISHSRHLVDKVYANERLVKSDDDVLYEAYLMDALGTGITGGEPLLKLKRVMHYITLLKNEFGVDHHIHLYTSSAPDDRTLTKLQEVGLDEIRFHPPVELWDEFGSSKYHKALKNAKLLGLNVGVEIPAIKYVPEILKVLARIGGFLNLNELEFSETNYTEMIKMGFVPSEENQAAVGSKQVANFMDDYKVPVYFCSSSSKDSIQLRERFKRKAHRVARPFDEITEDGTLVYGVITGSIDCNILNELECDEYEIVDGSIETSWWIAEEVAHTYRSNRFTVTIIERHPEGTIVEITPL